MQMIAVTEDSPSDCWGCSVTAVFAGAVVVVPANSSLRQAYHGISFFLEACKGGTTATVAAAVDWQHA
jgi:hypothetical protein